VSPDFITHSEEATRVRPPETQEAFFLRVFLGADDHRLVREHLLDFGGRRPVPGDMLDVGRVPVELQAYSVNTA
jgi:hypothetical protein